MKKIVKSATLAVALVSCASIALPALSQASVFAAEHQRSIVSIESGDVDKYLKVPNFISTGNVGTEYTFATAEAASIGGEAVSTFTTEIELVNPYGQDATAEIVGGKFTPKMAGTYKVIYNLLNADSEIVATSEFDLNIAGVSTDYKISTPINSENIVPSTVSTKDKDGNATVVTFPAVDEIIVYDANGETLTYGKIQDLGMDIVLATPTADNGAIINWNANERKLTVDATKEVNTTYTALYSLVKGDTKLANVKISFVAKKDYTAPTYTYIYVGTKPTTAEIGVETILPSVSATSTDNKESVDVYYTIKITHTNSVTKAEETYTPNQAGNGVLTVENGIFTFTPNDTGSYVVEYIIKDFRGNAPTTSTTKFSIDNVSQTTAPTPKVSLPYEDEGDGVDAIEAFKEVQLANNIMILPIDADDNANGLLPEGQKNLTLYRQIWDASKSGDEGLIYDESAIAVDDRQVTKALIFNSNTNLDDIDVYVNGKTTTIAKATDMSVVDDTNAGWKTATKTLSEGSYVVKYFAKNKLSGKDEVMLSVPLKIVDTFTPEELSAAPTVTFDATTTLPSSANLGDSITFKAPTATQKTEGNYSHTTLTTYVLYQLVVNGTPENTYHRYDEDNSWISLNEEKTQYTLSIPEDRIDVTAINVFACAKNDLGNVNDFENDTKVAKEIKIIGTGDTQATTIESVTDDLGEKKQGQKVVLPSVVYDDDLPQFLNVKIVIDGDEQAYNGVYDIDGSEVEFSDAYFTPEEAKTYTISYISTDAGRNQTILTFTLKVNPDAATFNANFIGLPSTISSGTAELGDKISIPSVDVKVSHPDDLVAEDWYVVIEGPANVSTDNKTYATFNKVGEYTIQYFCNVHDQTYAYDNRIKSEKYTIKVTDTKGPQLLNEVAIEDCFNDITKNGALAKNETTIKFVPVIPDQKAENAVYVVLPQAKDVVYKDSTLSIVASGITLKTYNLDDLDTLESGLLLSRDDVYQFTFTLKDANGNTTTTDTYKVDVGDVYAPEVKVEDGVVASNYTVGNTVNIDFSKINVTDIVIDGEGTQTEVKVITKTEDGKYVLKDGYKLTITVTGTNDSDSLTVSDTVNPDKKNNLEAFFKFTGLAADEYTLKVSVTDASTKVGTNSDITFKVSAESKSPISGEDVLGIVLIVVAVVALGGVVTYFVVTRKKSKNKF